MEIQQSSYYADFIRNFGWKVETLGTQYIYIRPFPFIGGLAKIQRGIALPHIQSLIPIIKKYRVRTLALEPDSTISQSVFTAWTKKIKPFVRLNADYFLPTKTIRVPLNNSHDAIFHAFSEAKRRAVRRAEKNTVTVEISDDIDALIRLKNKSAGFLGFITTAGVRTLWDAFPKKNKAVLIAYQKETRENPVGGILLFFWDSIAYYWIAGATKNGKKLFAPTLLIWEALKESKKRNCTSLDFVGVWDERIPAKNQKWHGFTKFKEGFGGHALYYPLVQNIRYSQSLQS